MVTKKLVHNTLVMINDDRSAVHSYIKAGVQKYCDWLNVTTGGQLVVKPTFQIIDTAYVTHPVDIAIGQTNAMTKGYLIDARVIAEDASVYEKKLKKEFDTVCLFNSPDKVIGKPPTNPAHSPTYVYGFTVFQLLTYSGWGTDLAVYPPGIVTDLIAQTFAHEMLHAMTFIINYEYGKFVIPDLTHQRQAYDSEGNLGYDAVINSLMKPYWRLLVGEQVMSHETITQNLQYGDSNAQVHLLQDILQDAGYLEEGVYGPYGPMTARAVLAWQLDRKVDNPLVLLFLRGKYFGPRSRAIMNA